LQSFSRRNNTQGEKGREKKGGGRSEDVSLRGLFVPGKEKRLARRCGVDFFVSGRGKKEEKGKG